MLGRRFECHSMLLSSRRRRFAHQACSVGMPPQASLMAMTSLAFLAIHESPHCRLPECTPRRYVGALPIHTSAYFASSLSSRAGGARRSAVSVTVV